MQKSKEWKQIIKEANAVSWKRDGMIKEISSGGEEKQLEELGM